jgi:hypothetical protein
MTKQLFKSLDFSILIFVAFLTLLTATQAQTRPRKVNPQPPQETRPRRAKTPHTAPTEKDAARRVDEFLNRIDRLAQEYLLPMKTHR